MPDSASIDAVGPDGTCLRVEFIWRGDRYGHELKFVPIDSAGSAYSLACSLEGSPSDEWPASPAFQQLLVEDRGPGLRVALLVGMSGTSHWSASVEPIPGAAAFVFDVACRLRAPPPALQSNYEDFVSRSDSPEFALGRSLLLSTEPPTQLIRSSTGWSIRASLADAKYPCTARWRYRINLNSSP